MEEDKFNFLTEQFDDIKILRYQVPAFGQLPLREKIFVYYLSQAALAGRDILWDQNNRYNLRIRKILERIVREYPGDRNTDEFGRFLIYTKKVFFANGIHHHYSMDKFIPGFSKTYFQELLASIGIPEVFPELERVMFDSGYMAKRVVLDEGKDLIRASANNYYMNVTQREVEEFYRTSGEEDSCPVSRGLNSILINKGLKEYGGDLMIGAYGIVNRLAFFFVMIVLGVNQGMQPIAGYNFGAKQYDRVMRVLKLTMIGATCVTTAGFLLGEFMPRLAVGMFTSDEELIRLAVEGMRIVFFCFPIIGFQMVATNFFMSIGMAGKAIFLSLSRQLLFLMPGLIFLPHIFDVCTEWNGSWGVWCSMPLSDFLASLVAFFMLTYQLRKFRAIGAENAAKEG